jgi:O-antigen/teichoic acid export membrane protein
MSLSIAELPKEFAPEVSPVADGDTSTWPPVAAPAPELELAAGGNQPLSKEVTRHLVGGTSALGLSVAVERGVGLLANILAARLGGKSVFGAYSFAIGTANQISMYAAGGIGATATRFSGKYPRESAGYPTLRRALMIVSLASAALAAVGLWLGAAPIAHLVGKVSMTNLLRWAAISSVGIILLECARGFFVGQRHLMALLTLSLLVGLGMVTLLPTMAHRHDPRAMLVAQGLVAIAAVALCLVFGRKLGLRLPASGERALPLRPMLREVWAFGGIQLASLIGSNISGWWLTAVVARNDPSLVQVSFLTIASQLRNLVALAPTLLTEGSYAVMADPRHEESQTPQRVMALCSYASLALSLLLALAGMTVVPWMLALLYGKAYAGAGTTLALGLATAVAHMGNAPAAARLTIVSLRSTAVINTIWAVFVAAAATLMLVRGGSAAEAMGVYFVGHIVSATLVLLMLRRKDNLPAGMLPLFGLGMLAVAVGSALALLRSAQPSIGGTVTAGMAGLLLASAAMLWLLGKRHDWLPPRSAFRSLLAKLQGFAGGRLRRV